ncbi:putative leader peptide [Pseudonocardia pini]|nr:putative leader peptide [Pseudonocardia pini]
MGAVVRIGAATVGFVGYRRRHIDLLRVAGACCSS